MVLIEKAYTLLAQNVLVLAVTCLCSSCVQSKIKSTFARLWRNNGYGKGKEEQRMGILTPRRVGVAAKRGSITKWPSLCSQQRFYSQDPVSSLDSKILWLL